MKERIYLSNWAFNAGIIGFIKINIGNQSIQEQNMFTIGNNYIEFDASILEGFTDKYFDYFDKFNKYKNNIKKYIEKLSDNNLNNNINIKEYIKNIDEIKRYIKTTLKYVKNDIEEINKKNLNKEKLLLFYNQVNNILYDNQDEFKIKDIKLYSKIFYGEQSFLGHHSKNKNYLENKQQFYNDFVKPILEIKDIQANKICVCCNKAIIVNKENKELKNNYFNTKTFFTYGANKDNLNFFWNFNSNSALPLCKICELVYFCSFASLSKSSTNYEKYHFANQDASIYDLYQLNVILNSINNNDNFKDSFFTEIALNIESFKAKNISVIEINNKKNFSYIESFNIGKNKAIFLKENREILKKFEKLNYQHISQKKHYNYNILTDLIKMILDNSLSFNYIYKLLKIYMIGSKSTQYNCYYNPKNLQYINLIINNKEKEGGIMSDKELWNIHYKGQELRKQFLDRKRENQINSIAYKLLNALKINDVDTFLNVLMRLYIGFNLEFPSSFVNSLKDDKNFNLSGYSFLTGFMGSNNNSNIQEANHE